VAVDSIQIPEYEILRPLGKGGMSTVYLALQRSLDRKIAIKVMRRGLAGDIAEDQSEKRFLQEGRIMAKLPHRNIVAVHDIVSDDGIAYIAMEFLEGGMLSDRMSRGLSLAEAVSVIVQIANALEFAHQHGVVHRDLKPANVLFRDAGTPVLTDFGIARWQEGTAAQRLTQTGMMVGTPTYMSPEQINGSQTDGRADQYSLGVLFYELLTGAPPFRADAPIALLMAHLNQGPPALPEEFAAFRDVVARMLAKNRDDRYPTLAAFVEDLKSRVIGSDTLTMRLLADPNQASSEQLGALGFFTAPLAVGGVRGTSMQMRKRGNRLRKRAPRLVWIGLALTLLVLAVFVIGSRVGVVTATGRSSPSAQGNVLLAKPPAEAAVVAATASAAPRPAPQTVAAVAAPATTAPALPSAPPTREAAPVHAAQSAPRKSRNVPLAHVVATTAANDISDSARQRCVLIMQKIGIGEALTAEERGILNSCK